MKLLYPWAIMLIIPFFIILIILIGRTFVTFCNDDERKRFNRGRRIDKIALIITRTLIAALLLIALASPYEFKNVETPGDPALTILVDKTQSFSLFPQGIEEDLKKSTGSRIPVSIKTLDEGNRSALGNGIRNTIQGNDNILLITDGYVTDGWNLADAVVFARQRNSIISALALTPQEADASVVVEGPSDVIHQTENEYRVIVRTTGKLKYKLKVIADGEKVIETDGTEAKEYTFRRIFSKGYHKIQAVLYVDDAFPQNNMYYKTVKSLPRPKVLFVSKSNSPLFNIVDEMYEATSSFVVPSNLEGYHAVILNNIAEQELKDSVEGLTSYLEAGNGLFFIGGDQTFEYNDHCEANKKDCLVRNLLPVQVGYGGTENIGSTNLVIAIDISGSAGEEFGAGSSTQKLAIQKALALEILKSLKIDDNIAVVAFNTNYRLIADLKPVYEQPTLNQSIAKLQFLGGTIISQGLRKANDVLMKAQGSKSVVVISDGNTDGPELAIQLARAMHEQGITIYTVGIGENTNAQVMSAIAEAGGGVYLQPTQAQRLKLIMGNTQEQKETKEYALQVLNANSFITQGLTLDSKITGFNQVIPKNSGRVLVTTEFNNPVLSSWRFGLGRVVVLSTDDGSKWGAGLLGKKQSILLTRSLNYAIGDPDRLKDFAVKIPDTHVGETTDITVYASSMPTLKGYTFKKYEQGKRDMFTASFTPDKTGFIPFFDGFTAVNYPLELEQVGFNPDMQDIVSLGGGALFKPTDIDGILEKVKKESKRITTDYEFYRWPFIALALLLIIIEIAWRRYREAKHFREG